MSIAYFVAGRPAPQGSKRAFVRGGRPVLVESAGPSVATWRQDVIVASRAAIDECGWEIPHGAVHVSLGFHLERPKSRQFALWHPTRPDLDKLVRATLDALTIAKILEDDSRVAMLTASKIYARADLPTGVHVHVNGLREWE